MRSILIFALASLAAFAVLTGCQSQKEHHFPEPVQHAPADSSLPA